MLDIQKRIFDHLTIPGHPQRLECLEDLINIGVLSSNHTNDEVDFMVGRYLDNNVRGFCDEGIKRLRGVLRNWLYDDGWYVVRETTERIFVTFPKGRSLEVNRDNATFQFAKDSEIATALRKALSVQDNRKG